MPASDKIEITTMINDCVRRLNRCNEWEQGFIKSIQKRNAAGTELTKPMIDRLDEIWEKVT